MIRSTTWIAERLRSSLSITFAIAIALMLVTSTDVFAEDLTASQILVAHQAGAREENIIRVILDAPSVAVASPAQLDSLRAAGVSERVIQAFVDRSSAAAAQGGPGTARAAAGAAQAAAGAAQAAAGAAEAARADTVANPGNQPSAGSPPAPAKTATVTVSVANPSGEIAVAPAVATPGQSMKFEPLVRMTSRLKKDRMGSFGLKDNRVEWYDAKESKDNFSLFGNVLKTVWLECEPRAAGNFCFELGMNTLTGETYRFRDLNWEKGDNTHIMELYQTLKTRYPQVVFQEKVKSR